ncbi:hypothetical protein WAI453_007373 [Rhynchosporium graminicola]
MPVYASLTPVHFAIPRRETIIVVTFLGNGYLEANLPQNGCRVVALQSVLPQAGVEKSQEYDMRLREDIHPSYISI